MVPIILNLLDVVTKPPPPGLSKVLQAVYSSLADNLNYYFPNIKRPENLVAVLLDPRFKGCTMLEAAEKQAAVEYLQRIYDDACGTTPAAVTTSTTTTTMTVTTVTNISMVNRKSTSVFGKALQSSSHSGTELEEYLNEPIAPVDTNILQYWHDMRTKRPVLAALARKYLAQLSTAVDCESLWSNAGFITSEKRRCLDPDSVSMLTCLYRNIRQLKKLNVTIWD